VSFKELVTLEQALTGVTWSATVAALVHTLLKGAFVTAGVVRGEAVRGFDHQISVRLTPTFLPCRNKGLSMSCTDQYVVSKELKSAHTMTECVAVLAVSIFFAAIASFRLSSLLWKTDSMQSHMVIGPTE
jgi:hypothetical protein